MFVYLYHCIDVYTPQAVGIFQSGCQGCYPNTDINKCEYNGDRESRRHQQQL